MRIITGEGSVLLENNKIQHANIDSSFFVEKYNQLEKENKKLLIEVGVLKGRLQELKKRVPKADNAICADVSGSDLEE